VVRHPFERIISAYMDKLSNYNRDLKFRYILSLLYSRYRIQCTSLPGRFRCSGDSRNFLNSIY
jgi:hypothetical protein